MGYKAQNSMKAKSVTEEKFKYLKTMINANDAKLMHLTNQDLASEFGVSWRAISRVRMCKTWGEYLKKK